MADDVDEEADQQAVEEAEKTAGIASTRFRWRWLSTVTALLVVVSWHAVIGFVLAGRFEFSELTQFSALLFHTGYGTALVYAIGADAMSEWQDLKPGGSK